MAMISYSAPPLAQFADEELVLEVGAVFDPGLVERRSGENGLWLWVEGNAGEAASGQAFRRFRVLLGIVRIWNPQAGELVQEREAIFGSRPARDDRGNQTGRVGVATEYARAPGEVETFARRAGVASASSSGLCEALELYGKANREAADYYNIAELCVVDLATGSMVNDRFADRLQVRRQDMQVFSWSANNLAAVYGGRHAKQDRADKPPCRGCRDVESGRNAQVCGWTRKVLDRCRDYRGSGRLNRFRVWFANENPPAGLP